MPSKLDNLRTERLSAGHSVSRMATLANLSDQLVKVVEDGGDIETHHAQRVADALGVSLATLGQRVMV